MEKDVPVSAGPLRLARVSKTFPGQVALNSVDLTVEYGQVHALLGQNGSGKSTLIKILSGYYHPDEGSLVELDGERFELGSSERAREAGLRFVHQDLGLVLDLSILENVMLGREYETGFGGRILWRRTAELAQPFLRQMGITAKLSTPVRSLGLAERTAVAIARALADATHDKLMIVLDEPTAALPPDEIGALLNVIDRLRSDGHGVLIVSHHLNEVLRIADHFTVLRDGVVVASLPRSDVDHDRLTELIVGHKLVTGEAQRATAPPLGEESEARLRVRNLAGASLRGVDIDVMPGEIVGVAGITGSGREALGPLLTGRLPFRGEVHVDGNRLTPGNVSRALDQGLASVPGERHQYGLFPNLGVRANMTISDLGPHVNRGRIRPTTERAEVRSWIDKLGIVTRGPDAAIMSLSGGNQQKVLVARALRLNPKVLVLDDPTMGVDIGAREQMHLVIEQCAADGMAVLLVSADSDELARLSSRVLILSGGHVVRSLTPEDGMTVDDIDAGLLTPSN